MFVILSPRRFPLVESTVVESAVLIKDIYLPEILDGDSPTVNIVKCCNLHLKKPSSYNPGLCDRWQSVAWKPIMHFDFTTLYDVKAIPIKLDRFTAKRKSR